MKNLETSQSKRAYVYCRVPTDAQAKQLTLSDQQEADARKLCEDRGIAVVRVFTDRGFNGSDRSSYLGVDLWCHGSEWSCGLVYLDHLHLLLLEGLLLV